MEFRDAEGFFNTFFDTYSEIGWSFFLKVSSSKKLLKIFDMEIFETLGKFFRWTFLRTHGINIFEKFSSLFS